MSKTSLKPLKNPFLLFSDTASSVSENPKIINSFASLPKNGLSLQSSIQINPFSPKIYPHQTYA